MQHCPADLPHAWRMRLDSTVSTWSDLGDGAIEMDEKAPELDEVIEVLDIAVLHDEPPSAAISNKSST